MPLMIVVRNGLSCPAVICDHCGREIEHGTDGNYQWHLGEAMPETIYFTHKACCLAFEAANPGTPLDNWFWGAMELSLLPVYLMRNLKIDFRRAKADANLMSSIG